MSLKKIIIILILLTSTLSYGEEHRGVPEKLFGILLGGVYDLGDPNNINDLGDIPVKKCTGIMEARSLAQPLGDGILYFFQPTKDYEGFKYIEMRQKPEEQYFETSFQLSLLPVIPSSIKTKEELENAKLKWEVTAIKWFSTEKTDIGRNLWASELCKLFKTDISVEPKIYDGSWHECTFSSGDREFRVSSMAYAKVELSYKKEVLEAKSEALNKIIRKLQADKIRPY